MSANDVSSKWSRGITNQKQVEKRQNERKWEERKKERKTDTNEEKEGTKEKGTAVENQ